MAETLRGCSLLVFLNNKPWAVCDNLTWSVNYSAEPIFGIDQLEPFEIPTGRISITGSFNYFRQKNSAGAEGAGWVPPQDDVSRERYPYLVISDRESQTVYLEIPKCKITSQSGSAQARGVVTGTISFSGIGYVNEM